MGRTRVFLSESAAAKAGVLFYDKEKPRMGRGAAGQLILTGCRLVYVKYLWGARTRRNQGLRR